MGQEAAIEIENEKRRQKRGKCTRVIKWLSFVLKGKAIHKKEQRKNKGMRVNKGDSGERKICITESRRNLIGSVANNMARVDAELCFRATTAGSLRISNTG